VVVNGYFEVELTSATAAPVDPPVFSIPKEWFEVSDDE
jgi:hypothetical protein